MVMRPVIPRRRLILGLAGWRSGAQWIGISTSKSTLFGQRCFADRPNVPSDPAFLPGSQSAAASPKVPPPPGAVKPLPGNTPARATPATPTSSTTIPPENVPLTPPPPPTKTQTSPPTTIPPASSSSSQSAPSPSPPSPNSKRRGLRLLLYLLSFSGLSYAAGIFYALKSDNFHDFFTEYVPFGEEAVLYFEERSFRKRFPNARIHQNRAPVSVQRDGNKVTIPSKSGISWRLSDETESGGSDLSQKGRHMSALEANTPSKIDVKNPQQDPDQADHVKNPAAVEAAKQASPSSNATPAPEKKREKTLETMSAASPATPSPNSDSRPPAIAPVTHLSPLEIPHAEEPLVQELAKIVNDLITVVNADSPDASNKYSTPIAKAKDSLAGMGVKINLLKQAEREAAENKIDDARRHFEESAKELARRIDAARGEELALYREEFESEREKLSRSFSDKLKTEVDRVQRLSEQRLENELREQAIKLKRGFIADVKSLVEQERDGRLSKLSELSTKVNELQKLTSDWNGVIESNLATQRLQVAVDAVRSSISQAIAAEGRPKPFLNELAALKEIANGDPVVDAAIASMNPSAYQRGIPSPAQLIDRFRRVSSEVRKASLLPENAGVASHAASLVLSKAMFKKQGHPPGGDAESVLTRTETLLEEGDLDSAAREMNTLQGWAAVLAKDWLQECRKVLEVKQALDVIETEARLQCLRVE